MPGRNKPVRLTPLARADLGEIWDYTAETWSPQQAERYTDLIIDAFDDIETAPLRGTDMSDLRAGYRRWSIGQHYIFYRETDTTIEVVRILHHVRDHLRHL